MNYTLAMDDHLLKVFYDFKRGAIAETSTATIQNLLRLYHPPHITSAAQLKAVGVDDPSVLQQLAGVGLISQKPEDLIDRTQYKIILSEDQAEYPNVCVHSDHVSSQFVMSFSAGEDRDKAHEWLAALLAEAKSVTVVDGYLCDGQTQKLKANARSFFDLFPKSELSVFLSRVKQPGIADIKKLCSYWKVKTDTNPRYRNAHDRYVLIDRKMEIVITSGIDYLFDTDKECTLLVRKMTSKVL